MGIENITVDLIYGIPNKGFDYWEEQLGQVIELNVPHISSYCLTIEQNTVFGHRFRYGQLNVPSDEEALIQFDMMVDQFVDAGFVHYEISNFAKEGFISKHNSAYWLGKPYLGIGPSAHSYNGIERRWNVSNNHEYIKKVNSGEDYSGAEILTDKDKFNDYILTRLRTHWGIDMEQIKQLGQGMDLNEFYRFIEYHIDLQNIVRINNEIRLTEHGKFIADRIAADLFV